MIGPEGIQADPEKTEAIVRMSASTSVPELRRFMGMVNQLGKFTPNLAELTQPLCEQLSKVWGPSQSRAFKQVKQELSKPASLALYDPEAQTKISADASSYGLGAMLLQQVDGAWKRVAYASRLMSETERRYTQIEKEALAITWACDGFILGKHIEIETDCKPLVPLLGEKHLDSLPPRVLRFRLRLDRFDYLIKHVPGKELYMADTLSQTPLRGATSDDSIALQELAELCVIKTISHLPASAQWQETYRNAQSQDPECELLFKYCREGWPDRRAIDPMATPYWDAQGNLTVGDGILLCGGRIMVPKALRAVTLKKLHEGHQGIVRCRLRAKTAVWWPGISQQVTDFVKKCPECTRDSSPCKESLIPTPLPEYPWQVISASGKAISADRRLLFEIP